MKPSKFINPFEDDRVAAEWAEMVEGPAADVRLEDLYPRLSRWLAKGDGRDVLDLGCGQGVCSAHLPLEGKNYTGVDASALLIDRAAALYPSPKRKFIQGNAYALPFPEGAFDQVFSISVWHLLADLPRAARELARVLRPQGTFFLVVPNPDAIEAWKNRYQKAVVSGNRLEGETTLKDGSSYLETLFLYDRTEIEGALQAVGLKVVTAETFRPSDSSPGAKGIYCAIEGRKSD